VPAPAQMKIRGTEATLPDQPAVMPLPAVAPALGNKPTPPAHPAARAATSVAQRPAPAPAPPAQAAAPPAEGLVLADPVLGSPAKPIAQVVSKHPPLATPSFSDLLRRSLSARPR